MIGVFKIIHGFDPGFNTGYVKYDRSLKKVLKHDIAIGYEEVMQLLHKINNYDEMIVMETNHGKMSTKTQFDMCKMVGFIEGVCEVHNIHLIGQIPQKRIGYVRHASNYFKQFEKDYECHNIDAFAHVLAFIDKKEGIETFKKLSKRG